MPAVSAFPTPLYEFLLHSVPPADLLLFLRMHYPDIVPGLPDTVVGAQQFTFATVERLRQFGHLEPALFLRLAEVRPGDSSLRTAAVALLGHDPFPAGGPGAARQDRHTFLVLMACPDDQANLDLSREAALIEEMLGQGQVRDRFQLVWGWSAGADETLDLLTDHAPTWLHFAGHGGRDGTLILAGADRTTIRVRYDALARFFGAMRKPPRCVALNACFSGIAAAPLTNHVDAVIGMRDPISDAAALAFSRRLYRELGKNRDLQQAFDLAKAGLGTLDPPSDHLPQLSCRAGVDARAISF